MERKLNKYKAKIVAKVGQEIEWRMQQEMEQKWRRNGGQGATNQDKMEQNME